MGFWKKDIHDDLKKAKKIEKVDEEFRLIIENIENIIKSGKLPHDQRMENKIYDFLKIIEKDINAAKEIARDVSLRLMHSPKK